MEKENFFPWLFPNTVYISSLSVILSMSLCVSSGYVTNVYAYFKLIQQCLNQNMQTNTSEFVTITRLQVCLNFFYLQTFLKNKIIFYKLALGMCYIKIIL